MSESEDAVGGAYLFDRAGCNALLEVVPHPLNVRPHEYRHNDGHERERDDPEAIDSVSARHCTILNDVHQIGVVVFDRPHIVEVHTLGVTKGQRLGAERVQITYEVSGQESQR